MFSRQMSFIIIAVCFIFTYPRISSSWNLNDTIGWSIRPFITYFIPLWFLLIFATYNYLKKKLLPVSNYFFWTHVMLSFVPIFFINYPFIQNTARVHTLFESQGNTLLSLNIVAYLYILSQWVLYFALVIKLFKR